MRKIYLLRANFHQQIGQAQEALADYAQAIQLAPESANAPTWDAPRFCARTARFKQSLADCYKAIQLNPADSAAYVCRAQFYLATGAAQPALEDINRAMLIGQNPAEAATLLSEAQQDGGHQGNKLQRLRSKPPPQPAPARPAPAQPAPAQPAPTQSTPPQPTSVQPPVVVAETLFRPPPLRPSGSRGSAAVGSESAADGSQRETAAVDSGGTKCIGAPQVLTPVVNAVPSAVTNKDARGSRDANRFYRQGRYLSEQENFEEAVQAFDAGDPDRSDPRAGAEWARLRATAAAPLPGRH